MLFLKNCYSNNNFELLNDTVAKIHHESNWKLSGYFNRNDNNWSQKKKQMVMLHHKYSDFVQRRKTSELLVSGSPVLSGRRNAEPFSTGPESGWTLVFSLLSPFHLFFLLLLYYIIVSSQGFAVQHFAVIVFQTEQILTFSQLFFGRANVQFRRNECRETYRFFYFLRQLITWKMQIEIATNQRLSYGNYTLMLPCLHIPINDVSISSYLTRLCN